MFEIERADIHPPTCYATLKRSHWIHALKQVKAQNQGRRAEPELWIWAEDRVLCIAGGKAFTVRVPFVGTWDAMMFVNRIALAKHASSLPAIDNVILAWADGHLSVGPTLFPGKFVRVGQ